MKIVRDIILEGVPFEHCSGWRQIQSSQRWIFVRWSYCNTLIIFIMFPLYMKIPYSILSSLTLPISCFVSIFLYEFQSQAFDIFLVSLPKIGMTWCKALLYTKQWNVSLIKVNKVPCHDSLYMIFSLVSSNRISQKDHHKHLTYNKIITPKKNMHRQNPSTTLRLLLFAMKWIRRLSTIYPSTLWISGSSLGLPFMELDGACSLHRYVTKMQEDKNNLEEIKINANLHLALTWRRQMLWTNIISSHRP